MIPRTWKIAVLCPFVAGAVVIPMSAHAEILDISGTATATIIQYNGFLEVQRDFSQEAVPLTRTAPPAVARARLDRLQQDGGITAAGQAVAVLDAPNLFGLGSPNDVGLDLGAFSDDSFTSWFVEGAVTERRNINISPGEISGDYVPGERTTASSKVVLSGVMVITSLDRNQDLTGAEVSLLVRVTQREEDEDPLIVLEGAVDLEGGPGGSIEVGSATGVFEGNTPLIVDFSDLPVNLPLARAILFTGLVLPYEYEFMADHPFDLELQVESQILVPPNGTGAAAVFGLPQDGFAAVFSRVKEDDRGRQLADEIARHVDTTGAAYVGAPVAPLLPPLFPLCGGLGVEAFGFALVAGFCLMAVRIGRRPAARQRKGA